jgi:hypothetical protein
MTAPSPALLTYRPEVRIVHLPWAGKVEIMSSEMGRWGLCNLGLLALHGAHVLELGDLLLTFDKDVVRVPILSLMLRPPGPRSSVGSGNAAAVLMQAMTSGYPLRNIVAEARTTILVEHRVQVSRGAPDEMQTIDQPTSGLHLPFLVELAGVLAIPPKGAK